MIESNGTNNELLLEERNRPKWFVTFVPALYRTPKVEKTFLLWESINGSPIESRGVHRFLPSEALCIPYTRLILWKSHSFNLPCSWKFAQRIVYLQCLPVCASKCMHAVRMLASVSWISWNGKSYRLILQVLGRRSLIEKPCRYRRSLIDSAWQKSWRDLRHLLEEKRT